MSQPASCKQGVRDAVCVAHLILARELGEAFAELLVEVGGVARILGWAVDGGLSRGGGRTCISYHGCQCFGNGRQRAVEWPSNGVKGPAHPCKCMHLPRPREVLPFRNRGRTMVGEAHVALYHGGSGFARCAPHVSPNCLIWCCCVDPRAHRDRPDARNRVSNAASTAPCT